MFKKILIANRGEPAREGAHQKDSDLIAADNRG